MKKIGLVLLIVMLLCPKIVDAQRGCCSHHGGVVGCSSSGKQICADGTLSPSCTCTPPTIYGCTDYKANNYNANANKDDGSCTYTIYGCMNKEATNYNSNANTSDGSCVFQKESIEEVAIPFETTYTTNKDLATEGKEGTKEITYQIQYNEQNEEINREIISEKITVEPVNQVIWQEEKKSEDESKEESPIFALFYIGIFIFNVIISKKKKEKKCIINKICSSKFKYLWLVIYFFLIIPAFIDFILLVIPKKS